jgi:hypothetical protein
MAETLVYYAGNLRRNLSNLFVDLDLKNWIRMIAVVGAYLLVRPYLQKLGMKTQSLEHEKEIDTGAILSPNSLRGQVDVPEDTDSEGGQADATGANWGKKARKRQRQMLRNVLDTDEKARKEQEDNEDDKDIMDLLVDYEEGKDGW